jgi:hypothetical protein
MLKALGLIPNTTKKKQNQKQKHLSFYNFSISMNINGREESRKGTDATLKCL